MTTCALFQLHDLVVPLDGLELNLHAERLGKGLCEIGVKANPAAVGVLIVHRGEVGDADDERALLLDVIEIGAGGRLFFPAAHQHVGDEGERKRGSGKFGKTVHNEFLQDGRPCRNLIR